MKRYVIIVVDEAQNVPDDTLEELRQRVDEGRLRRPEVDVERSEREPERGRLQGETRRQPPDLRDRGAFRWDPVPESSAQPLGKALE